MQDELAALFDRQMTMKVETESPVAYSISQHYHHSSHVVPPPPAMDAMDAMDVMDMLRQHGLDPDTLAPDQLELFAHADAEQQQRLVQTWKLYATSSPTGPTDDLDMEDSVDHRGEDQKGQAEPYMVSGYEAVAERSLPQEPTTGSHYSLSTDPVYKTGQWWESAIGESQYGAFQERDRFYSSCEVLPPQWLCPN